MNWRNQIRSAWEGITANVMRTALTMLGVIIGTASVIVMLALGNGARAAVEASFRSLGSDTILVNVKQELSGEKLVPFGKILSYKDGLEMPAAVPLVERVDMQVAGSVKLRRKHSVLDMQLIGSTANAFQDITTGGEVQPVKWEDGKQLRAQDFLLDGRFYTSSDVKDHAEVCVLGYDTWLELFQGDHAIGETIIANRMRCTVIGVLVELETVDASKRHNREVNEGVYLPISTAIDEFYTEEPSVEMTVRVVDESRIKDTKELVASYLRKRHGIEMNEEGEYEDDFYLTTRQDILGAQQESARTMSILLTSMAAVSLVVGGIGIMNVMLVSVSERTREIGIRMALGAEAEHIITQFLLESVLLSAAGGVLGIACGILAIPLAARLNGTALLAPYSILLSFAVALCVGVLFGLYPAVRAARLDPIQALHHE